MFTNTFETKLSFLCTKVSILSYATTYLAKKKLWYYTINERGFILRELWNCLLTFFFSFFFLALGVVICNFHNLFFFGIIENFIFCINEELKPFIDDILMAHNVPNISYVVSSFSCNWSSKVWYHIFCCHANFIVLIKKKKNLPCDLDILVHCIYAVIHSLII